MPETVTITIQFEVLKNAKNFPGAEDTADSLHEALSKLIHEDADYAADWLSSNIVNIT